MASSNEGSAQADGADRRERPELARNITVDESTSPRPAKGTLPHTAHSDVESVCVHGHHTPLYNRSVPGYDDRRCKMFSLPSERYLAVSVCIQLAVDLCFEGALYAH